MGFFSNLKNSLTGNWADVSVMMPAAVRGETATITVNVAVKDQEIEFEKIAVQVRCSEIIELPNYRVSGSSSASNGAKPGTSTATRTSQDVDVRHTEQLFTQEIVVAGAQSLPANSQHAFEGSVSIPTHLPPTLRGRHARFEWKAMASIDMKGNDPDSGWQDVEVR